MKCWNCEAELETFERVEFRARCPHCDRPVHVCRNCEHFDPSLYNQCRETMADRVVDKEAANFCEYYRPRTAQDSHPASPQADARARLEALFARKPR